ncbi:MAG: hypothetical protein KDA85_02715 [Planctomycetaceae bacterium]|nr:hypothetical protein [Planctomycetaceae bacterium]
MRIKSSSSLLSLATVMLLNPLSMVAAAPAAPAISSAEHLHWVTTTATDAGSAGWYRFVFDANPDGAESATLTLVSDGRCSLYLNGQRLLRQTTLERKEDNIQAAGFEVRTLLRRGRNSLTLELRSDAGTATAGLDLSLLAGQQSTTVTGTWKTAPETPPVGWSQTDFNDRDWTAVTPGTTAPDTLKFLIPEQFAAVKPAARARTVPFQLQDDDHVVLLGGTFFERAQQYGYLEAALSAAAGERHVTFRNLGWSADTVFAESRGIFDPPAQGYLRMIEHIRAEEPTVILINYGQNEALQNSISEEQFVQQYNRLLTDLEPTGAVMVLISPHELLPAIRPIPDPARFNGKLHHFANLVAQIAASRNLDFIDLFSHFTQDLQAAETFPHSGPATQTNGQTQPILAAAMASRWTENGMHFNDHGYAVVSEVFRNRLLSGASQPASISVNLLESATAGQHAMLRDVQWNPAADVLLQLQYQETQLSAQPLKVRINGTRMDLADLTMEVRDQRESRWPLSQQAAETDGQVQPDNDAEQAVYQIATNPDFEQLRSLVMQKNELYFHRWRPQNITYLYGFRKHEQGNNAVEIAQFDPLVQQLESQIHQNQQATWKTLVIRRSR